MNLAAEFTAWVQDPRRTNDELYLCELLVEAGHDNWRDANQVPWSRKYFDEKYEHERKRASDLAYRPRISRKKLLQTAEHREKVERIATGSMKDRPVRDLTALRFFPQLQAIEVFSALADLSGLKVLTGLKKLQLRDDCLADLSALVGHDQIEELTLNLHWPWPDLRSLAQLPRLKNFHYDGNLLAFAEVAELPAVERALFGYPSWGNLPLREVSQLPAMPRVRNLQIGATANLSGLERYTLVEELTLGGPFQDLTPLVALQNLRELKLHGERFGDLTPLARLPKLRTLELTREHGLDLTPLSDSPSLREVKSNCKVLQTELATLNAALGFVDISEFLAPEPRPLRPLRFISTQKEDHQAMGMHHREHPTAREQAFGDDPVMQPAECKWFSGLVRATLARFGDMNWIKIYELHTAISVSLYRVQEADQVHRMIEALRPLIAAARFPWEITLSVDLAGDPKEDDSDWERPDDNVFDVEREREDWEDRQQSRKERQERLEHEHQMLLQQQQGTPVEKPAVQIVDDEADENVPPAKTDLFGDEEEDDGDSEEDVDDRSFQFWLDGDIVWLHAGDEEDAKDFLPGVEIQEWHNLPEPPDQRPKWR